MVYTIYKIYLYDSILSYHSIYTTLLSQKGCPPLQTFETHSTKTMRDRYKKNVSE